MLVLTVVLSACVAAVSGTREVLGLEGACPLQENHFFDGVSFPAEQLISEPCECGDKQCGDTPNMICWKNMRNSKFFCKNAKTIPSSVEWYAAVNADLFQAFLSGEGGLVPVVAELLVRKIPETPTWCVPSPTIAQVPVEDQSNCYAQATACGMAAGFFENLYLTTLAGFHPAKIDIMAQTMKQRVGNDAYKALIHEQCLGKVDEVDPWLATRIKGKRGTVTIENKVWDHIFLLEFTANAGCYMFQAWTGRWTAANWVGATWNIPNKDDVDKDQRNQVNRMQQTNINVLELEPYLQARETYGLGRRFDCPSEEHTPVKNMVELLSKIHGIGEVPIPGHALWDDRWDADCQWNLELQIS